MSNKEIAQELGRMGGVRKASWATKEESELALTQEALRRILKLLIQGSTKQMQISKAEMETILVMYMVVRAEGQETNTMVNLVERIKKEKKK